MTKEIEIVEGNKLIAEFMDGVFDDKIKSLLVTPVKSPAGNYVNWTDKLKYHSSWDWLMPVVEKIQNMGFFVSILGDGRLPNTKELPTNYCNIFKDNFNLELIIDGGNIPSKSKIDSVWQSIIQFIQWYKTNK